MHNHPHHSHHYKHCHHSHKVNNLKNLSIVLIITAFYMVAEFFGGLITNSLALLADSGHMLSDVASLALSFVSIWLAQKHATSDKTYGYQRAEIIAAFVNGLALVVISILIFIEAFERLFNVESVNALTMIYIALGGLVVNIIGAFILHRGVEENLNVKGAFLHVIADLLGSIGAIIAGCCIYFYGLNIADPIISFVIGSLVLGSSYGIIKPSFNILMENVPEGLDADKIIVALKEIDGVLEVYDLHIWSINANSTALSVHLVSNHIMSEEVLHKAQHVLEEQFEILHSTIQIESPESNRQPCIFD